jgi:hypothetical protein
MADEERSKSLLTWPLIALAWSLVCLVAVAVWSPYSWAWLLVLGVAVVPSLVLVGVSVRWRWQHQRFAGALGVREEGE